MFGNSVYWTDWRSSSVIKANKWNGSDVSLVQKTKVQPFDLKIIDQSRQPKPNVIKNPCGLQGSNPCPGGGICLIDGNQTEHKCVCPYFTKQKDEKSGCVGEQKVPNAQILQNQNKILYFEIYFLRNENWNANFLE